MSRMTPDDSANIFNASEFDTTYWDKYLAARPRYSTEFYNIIYNHHINKGNGLFSIAHDIGAGPGQVAGAIASRVDLVHLSDVNERHLDLARHYLSQVPGSLEKASFTTCSGADIGDKHPVGAADLVFVGEALALMDVDAALNSFARVLKPGGTVAIWYYGRPMFAEGEHAVQSQKIYDSIVNSLFSKIIKGGGPTKQAQWKRTTDVMASWFDSVAFPSHTWTNVERHKWNPDGQMTFYDEDACDFEVTRSSEVLPREKLVEKVDRSFWADQWSVKDVRTFIDVNLPPFAGKDQRDETVESLYEELSVAMGGPTIKSEIAWPVVLLLATRKGDDDRGL